ncbi:MAG TPA: DegV family protein, partial [Deinococcales bacterium]|nr:DegV family protein [Deinococcales bacterium]
AEALGVTVVPLTVTFGGQNFPDGSGPSVPEMLAQVQAGAALPKTSQPTPAAFEAAFDRALTTASNVLCITLSSNLSGTFAVASLAARPYPGRVTVLDSLNSSGAQGLMVERAARLLSGGAGLVEVLDLLGRLRHLVSIRFSVATLEFLRKNGRIGAAQAFFGGLLNVRPLLEYQDGEMHAAGRPRGAERALQETVSGVTDYVNRHGKSRAWFIYSQSPEDAAPLQAACRGLDLEVVRSHQVGAVIASHVGPRAYGVCLEPLNVP